MSTSSGYIALPGTIPMYHELPMSEIRTACLARGITFAHPADTRPLRIRKKNPMPARGLKSTYELVQELYRHDRKAILSQHKQLTDSGELAKLEPQKQHMWESCIEFMEDCVKQDMKDVFEEHSDLVAERFERREKNYKYFGTTESGKFTHSKTRDENDDIEDEDLEEIIKTKQASLDDRIQKAWVAGLHSRPDKIAKKVRKPKKTKATKRSERAATAIGQSLDNLLVQ